MGNSAFESAVVFTVFIVICVLANSFNLEKFNRQLAPGRSPILKSHRLPFRFSLGSLLIAVTLSAVGTALVMFFIR